MTDNNIKKNRGFTLLEVVAVLIIMGIVSAIIVSRFVNDHVDLIEQTEVIKAHLRYAQTRAMNADTVWYIKFTNNTYSLYKHDDLNQKYLPGEDRTTKTLPDGISVGYGSSDIVSFDSWGKPCTDDAGLTLQTTDRTLTISCGLDSRSIEITRNTGFIK